MLRRPWLLALLVACGDDSKPASEVSDALPVETSDTPDLTGKSVYHLEFTFDGNPFVVDRDLTGQPQYFAFGSTHIAPAVSFGMTDSIQFPRTMTIGINFGIIVPSEDHPIQTEGAGNHPFASEPPSVDLFIGGLQYRSTLAGATGAVDLSQRGIETGDTVAGTFQGTLMSEGTTGRTLDVTGSFHFVLPDKNDGQPQ
jgi:hypothetical protein